MCVYDVLRVECGSVCMGGGCVCMCVYVCAYPYVSVSLRDVCAFKCNHVLYLLCLYMCIFSTCVTDFYASLCISTCVMYFYMCVCVSVCVYVYLCVGVCLVTSHPPPPLRPPAPRQTKKPQDGLTRREPSLLHGTIDSISFDCPPGGPRPDLAPLTTANAAANGSYIAFPRGIWHFLCVRL